MACSSISLRPEASNAYASCRAPCTGTGPIAATSPLRLHAICTFIPVYFAFPEYRSGIALQSHTGQTVPSTRAVPSRPSTWTGSRTYGASTLPMTGRSRSQRRLTVGWLQWKCAAAAVWVPLRRISMTTMTTESSSPATGGFFAGLDQRADFLHDQEAQLVQLPGGQPCESIVLQRFLPVILSVFDNHGSKRRGRCHVQGFLAFSANVHLCLWNCGELSAVPTAGVSERVNPGM